MQKSQVLSFRLKVSIALELRRSYGMEFHNSGAAQGERTGTIGFQVVRGFAEEFLIC